ncbi:MAG: hypothetical protein PGMFKBFP_00788 [Anaerolineales bacterium]|nr:hypothetical protein [Anaerolineales bacterium]
MSRNPSKPVPTLEEALDKLTADERMTELAKGITVTNVYEFIQKGERKKISKFVYERFYRRYIVPFEKVSPDYNSGFAQMAACCLMIEAMESFRYGWNDTSKDAKKDDGSKKYGNEIFDDFFGRYEEFKDFEGLGREFYSSIRCGILHQAEVQNGWMIAREGVLFEESSRAINSTIFRKRVKNCLRHYCDELEVAENDSDLWKKLKDKMAFIFENCHKGSVSEDNDG